MNGIHRALILSGALLMTSCGGGSSGNSGSDGASNPPPPLPAPTEVRLTLSTAPISDEIIYGEDYQVTLSGTWSATNLGTSQVYLQASDSANTFTMPAVTLAPANGAFSYPVPLSPSIVPGSYGGALTVRACADSQCISPYNGTSQKVAYSVKIDPVPEWQTLQGNAAHNGYVLEWPRFFGQGT